LKKGIKNAVVEIIVWRLNLKTIYSWGLIRGLPGKLSKGQFQWVGNLRIVMIHSAGQWLLQTFLLIGVWWYGMRGGGGGGVAKTIPV
jgi:hypothetical protein